VSIRSATSYPSTWVSSFTSHTNRVRSVLILAATFLLVGRAYAQSPSITSSNSTTLTVGTSGSFTVTATGSPTPTSSEAGNLPNGVTFNSGTGVLSGTSTGLAGTYPIEFIAHNGAGGNATNTFVQKTDQYFVTGTDAASESVAFSSNVGSGHLVFCTAGWWQTGVFVSSVSDTIGNTYFPLPVTINGSHIMQAFYAFSNSSGADTFTAHFTGSGGTSVGIACGEWSGPSSLDKHGEATGNSSTPTSASITPSSSGELLIGYGDDGINTWGASGAWTLRSTSASVRYGLEDQLSSGTSSVATGFTITSAQWEAGIVAFYSSASDAKQSFTLTMSPGSATSPVISSANNATFPLGSAGTFTVTTTGSPTPTLSESGALPSGVTFNAGTGVLSGTPASGTNGTYPITYTAHNGAGGNATNVLAQEKDVYFSNGTAATSESSAFSYSVNSGDLVFCSVGWQTGSSITSVSDTIGNTFYSLPVSVSSTFQLQAFYAFSKSNGSDTFTVNFSGSGATYASIACGEWIGPTSLDVHGEATGSSTTPTSASVTPSSAGELLIGYSAANSNNWTGTGSWTLLSTATSKPFGLEEQLSSGTSSVAAGFSIFSAHWDAGIAAFNSSVDTSQSFTLAVPPVPIITSTSTSSGAVGLHVTIAGTGFQTSPGSITFNGTTASVVGWTDTQIIAVVPSGATTGNIVATTSGGTSNGASFTVVTPPTISASKTPAPNGSGWNNSPVTVTFTCTAGGLTIASCTGPQVISTDGASQVITGTATDSAGDTATASVTISLDRTIPTLSVSSPADGASLSSSPTTVSGTLTDALSGASGVTCDGTAATLSSGSFSCNISLNVGVNVVVVRGTDVAGNVAGDNFHVTMTGSLSAATSIQVTPTGVNMVVGGTQQFTAVDQLGRPRTDATWSVDYTSIGTIDTNSSPTLTAVSTGTVTLTATVGSVTAYTAVTVVSGTSLSSGTVTWSAATPSGYTVSQTLQAVPATGSPDLYSVAENGSAILVTALTMDGQQMWVSQISGTYVSAHAGSDGNGGIYVDLEPTTTTERIVDLDAQTGTQIWEYDSSFPVANSSKRAFAVGSDGTVFFQNGIYSSVFAGYWEYTLESVDGTTGAHSILYSVPQATQTNQVGPPPCSGTASVFPFDASYLTAPIVGIDGSVYAGMSVTNATVCTGGTDSYTGTLSLVQLSNGSITVTPLHTYTSASYLSGGISPQAVIPDGTGGTLVSWSSPASASEITDVTSGGNSDLALSALSGPATQMVLGDSGSGLAYASDGASIVAFSIGGSSVWTYAPPSGYYLPQIIAATAGGGLSITTASTTSPYPRTLISLDNTGAATSSGVTGTISGPLPNLDDWLGITSGSLAEFNGPPDPLADSPYPLEGGDLQAQWAPPSCQRGTSRCAAVPTGEIHLGAGGSYPERDVTYGAFSLQSGNLTSSTNHMIGFREVSLSGNPTACIEGNIHTACDLRGNITDYLASQLFTGGATVSQKFFIDRTQVKVYWPQAVIISGGFQQIQYFGAYSQLAVINNSYTYGAIITQESPDSTGVLCGLACSNIMTNGTTIPR
jgi:large repetitive protein